MSDPAIEAQAIEQSQKMAEQKLKAVGILPDSALQVRAEDVDKSVPDILAEGLQTGLEELCNSADSLTDQGVSYIDPDMAEGEEKPELNEPDNSVAGAYASSEACKETMEAWVGKLVPAVRALGAELGTASQELEQNRFALAEEIAAGRTELSNRIVRDLEASLAPLRATAIQATHGFEAGANKLLYRLCSDNKQMLRLCLDPEALVSAAIDANGQEDVRLEAEALAMGDGLIEAAKQSDAAGARTVVAEYQSGKLNAGSNKKLGSFSTAGPELDELLQTGVESVRETMQETRNRLEAMLDRLDHTVASLDKNFQTAAGQMAAARQARLENVGAPDYAIKRAMLESLRSDIKGRINPEARTRAMAKKAELRAHMAEPEKQGAFILNDRGFWVQREETDTRPNLPKAD